MSFVAKLYDDDRLAERHSVMLDGTLRNPQAEPQDVIIDDLSATGFRTVLAMGLAVGDVITLGVFGVGLRSAQVMRKSEGQYGCQFLEPLSAEELASALCGLTPPEPVLLRHPAADNALDRTTRGSQAAPMIEWSLSPRWRVASITAAGVVPWVCVGLAWRFL